MMTKEDLYVSPVPGHLVSRYGSRSIYLGARVNPQTQAIEWIDDAVVMIPEREYVLYRREYDRLLSKGALLRRTMEDFLSFSARPAKADPVPAPEVEPEPTTEG